MAVERNDPATSGAMRDEQDLLWRRWRTDKDVSSREQLLLHYLPYARIVAASYYRHRAHDDIEFAEYLQFASVGLLESMDRFDPQAGIQFKTFAARRMHGAILNGMEKLTERQQQIVCRRQLLAERRASLRRSENVRQVTQKKPDDLFRYLADIGVGLVLAYLLEGTGMVDTEETPALLHQAYQRIELHQLQKKIHTRVNDLPQKERVVIRYHYLQDMPFCEIASLLQVSKGRIAQIHRQALQRLRKSLQEDGLDVAL